MASRRALRRRSCERKIRFATYAAAANRIRHDGLSALAPYGCVFCNGYHMGHGPRLTKEAIKARRQRQ